MCVLCEKAKFHALSVVSISKQAEAQHTVTITICTCCIEPGINCTCVLCEMAEFHALSVSLSVSMHLYCKHVYIPPTLVLSQEPLESIITPAGFTPATHPPSSQSSYYSPSPSHSSPSLHSHSSHPHSSQQSSHSELPPQESGSSYPTGVTTRVKDGVTKSEAKGTPPSTTRVTSSKEDSAASVSPHDGVPQHPDLIDPGSSFTSTGQLLSIVILCTYI